MCLTTRLFSYIKVCRSTALAIPRIRRQPTTNSSTSNELLSSTSSSLKNEVALLTSNPTVAKIALTSLRSMICWISSSVIFPVQSPSISLKRVCSVSMFSLLRAFCSCSTNSRSMLAINRASFTKIPVMMFITATTMTSTNSTMHTQYTAETPSNPSATSHQLTPPETLIQRVSSAMGNESKKILKVSVVGSSQVASFTCVTTA
mmetsp:Transcript_42266/g.111647  ORF Transcript_42266/g.111647 Transcript_42266/m.111647 type:complete len:204 (-) Transcript_42266:1201-1812(-)